MGGRETHPQSEFPRHLVITIDGPAGVGKSTVARQLAARLSYRYLDTGALYRAVAWKVRHAEVSPADLDAVAGLLARTRISVESSPAYPKVYVDGREVTTEIRLPEVSQLASLVSAIPAVREWLLPVQREMAPGGGLVAEGRDLGTRVFPKADVKFFLEAEAEVRAARRHQELSLSGPGSRSLRQTAEELYARDARDRGRAVAPLVPADDAIVIDTTALPVEQVLARMLAVIVTRS